MLVNSNKTILSYFSEGLNKNEELGLAQALEQIELRARSRCYVSKQGWREFSVRRLFGSGSLSHRQGLSHWDRLNEYIYTNISEGVSPDIPALKIMNSIICPLAGGRIRTCESRGGEKKFIRQLDLPLFLDKMQKEVFEPSEVHPIWQAFQLYSWGVTLHPFIDGNGRTFRAAADWVLLQNGYLPLTCRSSVAAHVAVCRNVALPERSSRFANFLAGLMNSYKFLYQ